MASLQIPLAHIDRQGRSHLAREIEPIRIHVGDHDFARAGHFGDRHRHATDWSRAGDEHVFADQIERQGGMDGVAKWIGTGNHIERDLRIAPPEIRARHRDIFGEAAGPIHADAFRVRAKMTPPGETVAAMTTNDVAFGGDDFAWRKIVDSAADSIDHADEFMTDHHRHRDRLLRPRIPVVNMNVGAADRGLWTRMRTSSVQLPELEPLPAKTRFGSTFHKRLHRLAHGVENSRATRPSAIVWSKLS